MLFQAKVLDVVRRIPKGSIMTYAGVAAAAGRPRACRAVGSILKRNADPAIPCHRVVRSDGRAGEYNGLRGMKTELLRREGVRINARGKIITGIHASHTGIRHQTGE